MQNKSTIIDYLLIKEKNRKKIHCFIGKKPIKTLIGSI